MEENKRSEEKTTQLQNVFKKKRPPATWSQLLFLDVARVSLSYQNTPFSFLRYFCQEYKRCHFPLFVIGSAYPYVRVLTFTELCVQSTGVTQWQLASSMPCSNRVPI